MEISEIYRILDEIAPFEAQENWDNSGLLVGNLSDKFERIYLSLDADSNLIDSCEPNSLLITHHPLIFKGLKSLNSGKFPANLICKMIKKDLKLIAMHTNFDKFCLNRFVASEILGLEIENCDEFLIHAKVPAGSDKFENFVKFVKEKLEIQTIRVVKANENIAKIAICTGSGMDLIDGVADCFLTGDIKYHDALAAYENGVSLIDIGHFESERHFGACLASHLQKNKIEVIIANSINPFEYR